MYEYLSPQGVIVPDTSEIKTTTEEEWKAVLGQDLDVSPETPQGILINSDVLVRSETAANNAAVANQINPNYAGGIFLDDIWALTGGKRRDATYTLVDGVNLTGVPGVVIPSGSRRETTSGDQFQLLSTVRLDSQGKGVGIFQAIEPGPISCGAHTLTVPVQGYTSVGWETSDNPSAGFVGQLTQSDISARQERKETLALRGRSLAEAVYSNLRVVYGLNSMSFRENYDDTDKTIDGIFLVKNSIWVCVDGGSDQDIATALYKSKSGGCGYNGAIQVNYKEPLFGQNHVIRFDRSSPVPVMIKVTAKVNGTATGDLEGQIKQAVIDYTSGVSSNGEVGFKLGVDVSPFEIASGVNYEVPSVFITKVEIAPLSTTPTWTVTTMEIGLNKKAQVDINDVSVVLT